MTKLTGVTQDISPLLHYEWYEPIYYREEVTEFPSRSKESFGWFVGIAEHVGHALTFLVLTEDTNKVLSRSVIRTATDPDSRNLRARNYTNNEPTQFVRSCIDDKVDALDNGETPGSITMPIIHPQELVGHSFAIPDDDGQLQHVKIVEALLDHKCQVQEH